jgi:hypothetical protein
VIVTFLSEEEEFNVRSERLYPVQACKNASVVEG